MFTEKPSVINTLRIDGLLSLGHELGRCRGRRWMRLRRISIHCYEVARWNVLGSVVIMKLPTCATSISSM